MTSSIKRLFSCALLAALAAGVLQPCTARATETESLGMQVLPAPAKVTVDGKTDDWDLTGGILVCGDVETARDKVSVWFHAMYDAQNLYLLARWIDPNPLNNPGVTSGDMGFQGDCLQVRIITAPETPNERTGHYTAWRGRDEKDLIDLVWGRQFDQGALKDAKSKGAQQAFAVNADEKGYVQEIAIPWSLLTKDGQPLAAGASLRMAVEPNFTIGANGRLSYKDIFQPGITLDRVFTFMSAPQWGTATLERQGKVKPRPVRLSDGREFAVRMEGGVPVVDWTGLIRSRELTGFKAIKLDMPEDGYVSLNIRDSSGTVVRQLLNCELVTKGTHEIKWNGLTTPNWRVPGEPVPPGDYTWAAIYHTGIGLRLKGWADNGGQTPWDFPANTGNWGGDHGVPVTAAADAEHVYLGWGAAEAGKALLACDTDGKVQWSNTHGGIAGAQMVTADGGVVYVLRDNDPNPEKKVVLYRVSSKDGAYTSWQGTDSTDLEITTPDGISAHGGKLYLAYSKANAIKVLDGATGREEKSITVPAPSSLKVVSPTSAFAISGGKELLAIDPSTGKSKPLADALGDAHGMSPAHGLAIGADGKIYVGDNGPDHQVKVFAADGKPLAAIGRKGGRAATGPWVGETLSTIADLAIDSKGQLWIAESELIPKRVSSWDPASGKLLKEFFGPSSYGALGGAINPADPDLMVGQSCEWRLDPKTGMAKCVGIITRGGMEVSRFGKGPDGRVYLAVAGNWAFNVGPLQIFERVGDADYKLRTVIFYADENGKELPVGGHGQPVPTKQTMVWADANGDGHRQPGEITGAPGEMRFSGWYMGITPDLTLYSGDKQFKTTGYSACGAPQYDLTKPTKMPAPGLGSADGRLVLQSGEYNVDHSWFHCYDIASGKLAWTYPDTFVGVHGSHNAPPAETGLIRGSFQPCGAVKLPKPLGSVWAIPTNVGEWHLLTEQGFYLTRLFQPDPLRIQWPEQATPGAILDNVPPGMGGEDFGGSMTLGNDGKLYLQAGKTAFWNVEVAGLDTVRELPGGKVTIAASDIKLAEKMREDDLQEGAARQQLLVKKLTPTFTGNIDNDFKGATQFRYQKQPDAAVRSAVAWDADNLYLAWEVKDATPWVNGASEAPMLYLGGDTVDFQLGIDPQADKDRGEAVLGDLRLSIGDFSGTPQAVIYRRLARDKHPRTFSSGVIKEYVMESVEGANDVKIEVRKGDKQYVVEAAVPLARLGLQPAEGLVLRGDFGVTHGDTAGKRTRLRTYWTNQHTGIVDDAVFELQMEPKNWGQLLFKQ